MKKLHAAAGYRMSDVNGHAPPINIRQVPGSLQSQYQTPYGSTRLRFHSKLDLEGETTTTTATAKDTPIGPTLPRSFRGNVFTLGSSLCFLDFIREAVIVA